MSTSEFINKKNDTKSVTSVVVIKNKKRFKKQLNQTNKDSLRHRNAMYKEFEIGHGIHCPYIVEYISINEDENGLYILMEHINGMNIAEKNGNGAGILQQPPTHRKDVAPTADGT